VVDGLEGRVTRGIVGANIRKAAKLPCRFRDPRVGVRREGVEGQGVFQKLDGDSPLRLFPELVPKAETVCGCRQAVGGFDRIFEV